MKVKVKLCGNKSLADLQKVVQTKADYVGVIFAESKRKVNPKDLVEWLKQVELGAGQQLVGVFVNPTIDEIKQVLEYVSLDIIQLHGNETVSEVLKVKEAFSIPVWKCIHHQPEGVQLMKVYQGVVDGYVIDSKIKGAWGGTGITFDWEAIPAYTTEANRQAVTCLIAGGIKPENANELLGKNPIGLDVSSGIETEGKKDLNKINRLIDKVINMKQSYPDAFGRFGKFGGKYVPETLMVPLQELEEALDEAMASQAYLDEYMHVLKEYSGRPTSLTFAQQLTEKLNGAKIYLKREDLNHTGAHKLNNAIGQALLAKKMGKKKLIAETGAGQHGVAAATVAAKFGMTCKVFMGEEDIRRQELNVFRMKLLGAEVIPVSSGNGTLKDATNEAIRYWVSNCEDHFYLIGSVVGPHPYPKMVRNFQRIIGDETKEQILSVEGRLPDSIYACVGGGSNAIGIFYPFIEDEVELIGVEAAGLGIDTSEHAATLAKGTPGVIHGSLTYLLQDENGQIIEPYSISAGLDYPGIGPEHAYLHASKRVRYESVTDQEALDALELLSITEGIIPAIESSHALAQAFKEIKNMHKEKIVVINVSGRGDKDMATLMDRFDKGGQ